MMNKKGVRWVWWITLFKEGPQPSAPNIEPFEPKLEFAFCGLADSLLSGETHFPFHENVRKNL